MLSQVSQEQSKPLLTMQFSTMLKKIKAKKENNLKLKLMQKKKKNLKNKWKMN